MVSRKALLRELGIKSPLPAALGATFKLGVAQRMNVNVGQQLQALHLPKAAVVRRGACAGSLLLRLQHGLRRLLAVSAQ